MITQPGASPNKPIRFLVAQTPGSSIDAISRVVATKMGELLGQQFVVDNRTGAGGIIAGAIVANAEPNGYTLLFGSEKRSTLWPEIPTVIESGLPGYVSDGWAGIVAPKGIPKAILEKLNATLVSAVRDPATVEALKRIGAEPLIGSPADFTRLIAKEWKNLGDAIRVSNLKVE